ncbi:glycosyltransferase family 4 protein [Cylindrospermopsis raciborskii CS-506_C]|uniref:Glycosyltransferase family 4 protein n=1 Tax=Cylindrospermopsis raciborskii CS-506_A TaxID=2585140 RepID=A0A838WP56_9CYAN|nr:glycosyltransferase family 4 protein [Cylindrospermopsis raciborskii]MBA4445800.1 glycosyltransferase family 4 protein [Cylindrospermopsis raciborskii CS-506_C]MBA4456649.1 glycosyltransferase family 4 protein [Cylindrospermopsis raciborskii CS-506_B]MBA4466010.1 glycosyltransferase family 4 protein [Cylindrospermopsis raciborskii CS-506_A]
MQLLLSSPGVGPFIQQTAKALYEASILHSYATTFVSYPESTWQKSLCGMAKIFKFNLERELQRRAITEIPLTYVHNYPWREILRTISSKLDQDGRLTDKLWEWSTKGFDHWVANHHLGTVGGVYGYETACLATFRAAKKQGLATIYELPAPEHDFVANILEQELTLYPQLRTSYYQYTQQLQQQRTEHGRQEWELADVIIVNSQFTKNSYAAAGLDMDKVRLIPLGAPPVREKLPNNSINSDKTMQFLWAGTFSIRKGAHYLVSAWQKLQPQEARLKVFGAMGLPENLLINLPKSIEFFPTVPRTELVKIYQVCDVLVFPTLCDGFGMVITEALAQGLPVITTNCAGASNLIQDGVNGLIIPPRDTEALAAAINWCLTHPSQVKEMSTAALKTAAQWQWSDYRQSLVANIQAGLKSAGYQ